MNVPPIFLRTAPDHAVVPASTALQRSGSPSCSKEVSKGAGYAATKMRSVRQRTNVKEPALETIDWSTRWTGSKVAQFSFCRMEWTACRSSCLRTSASRPLDGALSNPSYVQRNAHRQSMTLTRVPDRHERGVALPCRRGQLLEHAHRQTDPRRVTACRTGRGLSCSRSATVQTAPVLNCILRLEANGDSRRASVRRWSFPDSHSDPILYLTRRSSTWVTSSTLSAQSSSSSLSCRILGSAKALAWSAPRWRHAECTSRLVLSGFS